MEIEIHNNVHAEAFSSIFQHIKLFTEHINLTFEKERLYMQSMDSGNITIVELNLPNTWFDKYNIKSNIILGINASIFHKVLSIREKGQQIRLLVDKKRNDKLTVEFTGSTNESFNKSFELPLMDIESDLLAIPEFSTDVTINFDSSKFASMINQMSIFNDTIDFHCSQKGIVCKSCGNENGKMEVSIGNEFIETSIKQEMKLGFALHKLHDICMYSKLSKKVTILLTENFPIKFIYTIGDSEGKMMFYLAPKIDED